MHDFMDEEFEFDFREEEFWRGFPAVVPLDTPFQHNVVRHYLCMYMSKVTAPQDAHKKLVLQVRTH